MRILSCLAKSYYGDPVAVNPNFYNFVTIPLSLGHTVVFFDSIALSKIDKNMPNDLLCSAVKGGEYDIVLIETASDEFSRAALLEAKRYAVVLGFNSDDDFRWETYSSINADVFTYFVTTYRHIYKYAKNKGLNVIYCPWACSGMYDGLKTEKDIPFSFAGGVHGHRLKRLIQVNKQYPIQVYGKGSEVGKFDHISILKILKRKLMGGTGTRKMIRNYFLRKLNEQTGSISYMDANSIWSRTKVSFTPLTLENKHLVLKKKMANNYSEEIDPKNLVEWQNPYQIKGRVFDMGMSGTLMLCDSNPAITEHYDPGLEYIPFDSQEEAIELVKYYLAHEKERKAIAYNYYKRTTQNHLWKHRWEMIIKEIT